MTAEEAMAAATVAGVIVAALFGITGFIVGLVGLHHARLAREAAAGANLIAKESNTIAKGANTIAQGANTLSEESNGIAREANEIARRTVDRGDEQHDADWDWDFDREHDGMVTIQNIGKDPALGVTCQIFLLDQTEANPEPLDVAGRETIRLEIPTLAQAIAAERAARDHHESDYFIPGFGNMGFSAPYVPVPTGVRLRVKWRTRLGTPKNYDSGWKSSYLPQ